MKKKPSVAEITPEVIEAWKKEYAAVSVYKTEDGKTAYFKNPDLVTADAALSIAATSPIKSNVLLARGCFIGGDEEVTTEDKYIFGIGNHLRKLILKVEGELTTL